MKSTRWSKLCPDQLLNNPSEVDENLIKFFFDFQRKLYNPILKLFVLINRSPSLYFINNRSDTNSDGINVLFIETALIRVNKFTCLNFDMIQSYFFIRVPFKDKKIYFFSYYKFYHKNSSKINTRKFLIIFTDNTVIVIFWSFWLNKKTQETFGLLKLNQHIHFIQFNIERP